MGHDEHDLLHKAVHYGHQGLWIYGLINVISEAWDKLATFLSMHGVK